MANNLPMEKQVTAIGALAEGNSIRAIERMTGIHHDTIMRLGVRVKAVTVLAVPPISEPRKAVQAFIPSQYKREQEDEN